MDGHRVLPLIQAAVEMIERTRVLIAELDELLAKRL
jgi:hypothetical protein